MKALIITAVSLMLANFALADEARNLKINATKSPFMNYSPVEVYSFEGRLQLPNTIKISNGYALNKNDLIQLNIDDLITCDYRGVHYKIKEFRFDRCSDGSKVGQWLEVRDNIGLKIKKSSAFFTATTVNVTLNIQETDSDNPTVVEGPVGPMGPQGPQGIQGEKGDKGDTGAQGIQGIQGLKGDKGDTGAQGIQGLKGDKGDTGAQGIQGIQGLKGDKGDTGAQGIQGIQGLKGDKGDTGAQGIQGIQGLKGDKGDTGAQGIQGEKGDKGDNGAQGPQGIPGVDGAQGPQGIPGEKGDSASALVALVKDVKAKGVHGGTCFNDKWITRDLNNLSGDASFIQLGVNSFSLQAGSYLIEATTPAYFTGMHKSRLVGTSGRIFEGAAGYAQPTYTSNGISSISAMVTVIDLEEFTIQDICQMTKDGYGLGYASNLGDSETYTVIKITKIQ